MIRLNPYLFLTVIVKMHLIFYKLVFGNDFKYTRYKDVPHR